MTGPDSIPPGPPARTVALELERIACPLCGSEASTHFLTAVDNLCDVPGTFSIERCGRCRHLFMNPRPVIASLGACYPAQYGPHQSAPERPAPAAGTVADSAIPRRPWYLRYLPLRYVPGLRAFYFWLLEDRSQPLPSWPAGDSGTLPPRVIEPGCATGRYLQRLQSAGWSVVGIEPGEVPAQVARDAGLNVTTGVAESVEHPAESFDAAAAWMVIEHVPDPRTTLTRLCGWLKPGGQLLISVPNAGCWEPTVFGRYWYVWELPRHLHHFTPGSIRQLLSECGFADVRVHHQRTLLNVVGSLGIVLLNWKPASRLGRWLKSYPDHPTLWGQLLLAPLAHLLALLRQGGRLTIEARKPVN
jgi:SAM-dependent methyltransferase